MTRQESRAVFGAGKPETHARIILWDAEKIVLVCVPQSKGNPVYVPLYHIAAKLVLINMGGDKLS